MRRDMYHMSTADRLKDVATTTCKRCKPFQKFISPEKTYQYVFDAHLHLLYVMWVTCNTFRNFDFLSLSWIQCFPCR